MTNREKYDQVFIDCFSVSPEQLKQDLVYQGVPAWDSVGHMAMIAALEETFDIMMEMEDIIDFSSYSVGIEKLKKYDIHV